jgi:hypothetical protein
MSIDWNVVATITSPIIALFWGAALNRFSENRPKVVSYFGHVSGIFLSKENPPVQVSTHSVVLRNAGGKPESNIRLGHNVLPHADELIPLETVRTVETIWERFSPENNVALKRPTGESKKYLN